MPGWSSSTPAGEKTFACFRGHGAACLHLLTDCFMAFLFSLLHLLPLGLLRLLLSLLDDAPDLLALDRRQ